MFRKIERLEITEAYNKKYKAGMEHAVQAYLPSGASYCFITGATCAQKLYVLHLFARTTSVPLK